MGLLEKFEDSLDKMVSGAFARAFKAEVQPVEIASAIQREIDDRAAVMDRNRTVVPNVFAGALRDRARSEGSGASSRIDQLNAGRW
jgi:hypothetical protein